MRATRSSARREKAFLENIESVDLASESSSDDILSTPLTTKRQKPATGVNFEIRIEPKKTGHNKRTTEEDKAFISAKMPPKGRQNKRPRDDVEDSDESTGQRGKKTTKTRSKGAAQSANAKPNNKPPPPPKHTSKTFLKPSGHSSFREGTVYVQIARSDAKYIFAFEQSVLTRASHWFAKELDSDVKHSDPKLGKLIQKETGYDFRFELVHDEKYSPPWILKKSVSFKPFLGVKEDKV